MKIIQKLTLGLLTVVATSSAGFSANLIIDVDAGDTATVSSVITGTAQKIDAGTLVMSGANGSSLTNLEIAGGLVQYAASGNVGAQVTFNGGNLESTAAANIPALVMTADGTVTAGGDGALAGLSGASKLTIAGTGIVTPADLSAAAAPVDVSGIVNFGASAASKLPAADVNVLSGGLAKVMAATADCAPDDMIVQSGGVLEVADSVSVPAAGAAASGDLFGTLKFNTGSTLKLGNAAVWARAITVGTAL